MEQGATVYNSQGAEAEYISAHDDGHIVRELLLDDDGEAVGGRVTLWAEVFEEVPRVKYADEVQELAQKAVELRKEVAGLKSELIIEKDEAARRWKTVKAHEDLRLLEEFIQGRITHFVMDPGYGGPSIVNFHDQKSGNEKSERDIKLLSLFGRTNGDLQWRLNHYYDGSGSWTDVFPCTSEGAAKERLAARLNERWAALRKEGRVNYIYEHAAKSAEAHGIEVPEDIANTIHAYRVKEAQTKVDEASKQMERANEALASAIGVTPKAVPA